MGTPPETHSKIQLTPEQRKTAIDAQIRDRILRERATSPDLPVAAVSAARIAIHAGGDLQFACPYFRSCDYKTQRGVGVCVGETNYRKCIEYQVGFVSDIFENRIDLRALGWDKTMLFPDDSPFLG